MNRNNSVWVAFPSPNTQVTNAVLKKWHEQGYRSAVLIDAGQEHPKADIILEDPEYLGYCRSLNTLAQLCVREHGAEVVVASADDVDPDPNHTAEEILRCFLNRFPDTYGILQPMGDRFGALAPDAPTPAAVTPWIGREFAERIGPLHSGYRHYYADAEIWEVAKAMGVLWPATEFTQYHRHHSRGHADSLTVVQRAAVKANFLADRDLFLARKAAGFPGSEASVLV